MRKHYSGDKSLQFDAWRNGAPTVVDDPESPLYNLDDSIRHFVRYVESARHDFMNHGHFFAIVGDDF